MKNFFVLGAAAAVFAATLLPMTAAAQAFDEPATTVLTLAGTPASASFTQAVEGLFVDYYSVAPPTVSGPVSVALTSQGPLTFFTALLGDQVFEAPGDGASSLSFTGQASGDMPLTLTVFGFAGNVDDLSAAAGSYSGNVTLAAVAPIPEPETYALMLGGLALVALTLSRRRRAERQATR